MTPWEAGYETMRPARHYVGVIHRMRDDVRRESKRCPHVHSRPELATACARRMLPVEWFVTFGQQYPREPHPTFPGADHDGFVVIEAPDETTARRTAVDRLGQRWAFIYSADDWTAGDHADYYPKGELARWSTL